MSRRRPLLLAFVLVACTPIHEGGRDASEPDPVAAPAAMAVTPDAPSAIAVPDPAPEPAYSSGFVVHEWGTFTAIANAHGALLDWRPLGGPSDLPKFVYTQDEDTEQLEGQSYKQGLSAPVRMETPVLYFYADAPRTAKVRVGFPNGTITEWYPAADKSAGEVGNDVIDWGEISIVPGGDADLPKQRAPNHYYHARETDAAIVQRDHHGKTQSEKFLFYRGVGRFGLEPTTSVADGTLSLRDPKGSARVGFLVHVRGGRVGFVAVGGDASKVAVPAADGDPRLLAAAMRSALIESGLYAREADAMLATWRDHWLADEGVRLLYLMETDEVATKLPLTLEPAPDEIVRTIVGRIELVTPQRIVEIQHLVDDAASSSAACRELARRHGRFAEPLAASLTGARADAVQACVRKTL